MSILEVIELGLESLRQVSFTTLEVYWCPTYCVYHPRRNYWKRKATLEFPTKILDAPDRSSFVRTLPNLANEAMAPHSRRSRDLCPTPSCRARLAQLTLVFDQTPATLILGLGFETWPGDVLAGADDDWTWVYRDSMARRRSARYRWKADLPHRCASEDQFQSHQHFSKGHRRQDF